MKNVYFVQVDVSSGKDSKVVYLPYTSGVIIANAYKYAMMEDVLLTFENNNLTDEQAKALLKGKGHLEKILDRWQEDGTGHMDSMWEKAQEFATEMAEKQARIKDRGR